MDLGTLERQLALYQQDQRDKRQGPVSSPPAPVSHSVPEVAVVYAQDLNKPVTRPPQPESAALNPTGLPLPEFEATGPRPEGARIIDYDIMYPSAWYGSHGTGVSRVLSMSSTMVMESIRGDDDRVQITDPSAIPYRWLCSLVITAGNNTLWSGTGWLVSSRLVITAGHCVYMHGQGGWARKIDVFPQRNGNTRPYSFTTSQLHTVEGWSRWQLSEQDYGAMVLPRIATDQGLGHFGYGVLGDADLQGLLVNLAGYPMDKPGTLWGHARTLGTVLPTTLVYENDTYGGNSGAGLIRWDGSDYIVVGIHNYGDVTGNICTRITAPVFQNIERWKAMAAASP
jgi:V8-like Glu-specific endopeptidase